jgi:hypothetical protein
MSNRIWSEGKRTIVIYGHPLTLSRQLTLPLRIRGVRPRSLCEKPALVIWAMTYCSFGVK